MKELHRAGRWLRMKKGQLRLLKLCILIGYAGKREPAQQAFIVSVDTKYKTSRMAKKARLFACNLLRFFED